MAGMGSTRVEAPQPIERDDTLLRNKKKIRTQIEEGTEVKRKTWLGD